jgi:mannose-6-phosphate isomerase-like protein (cupin superfamily)
MARPIQASAVFAASGDDRSPAAVRPTTRASSAVRLWETSAMTAARAKAPTLAWLLTTLTGLLIGMAVVESRHQAVALPVWVPVGPTATVALATAPPVAFESSLPTPSPTPALLLGPGEEPASSRSLLLDGALVKLTADTAILRLDRLTVPPGTGLPAKAASNPMVLLVETGTLSVQVERAVWVGSGPNAAYPNTVLTSGQSIVVAAGDRHTVRNNDPTPAVALVVTIVPAHSQGATPDVAGEPGRSG